MYLLIKGGGSLIGIFTTKTLMKIVIEQMIQDDYERTGAYGNFHFRYIKFNPNDPWLGDKNGHYDKNVGKAIFSLFTMHTEYFTNEVETDWSTGKILKL